MAREIVTDGETGQRYINVTSEYIDMGRRKRTKMIIKDIKVEAGRCIVAVEIRRGSNSWRKAYGFSAEQLREGEFAEFQAAFEKRVLADALQLDEDKRFEERVLMRLEGMKEQQVYLD